MRIIKNPNPVEEIVKTCPECECEFAFTDGDIKIYSFSNNIIGPGYSGYRKRYVLCPNCGKEIVLEEKSTSGRNSMITIDFQKLIDEGSMNDEIIEDFSVFPHIENPEEDGEE